MKKVLWVVIVIFLVGCEENYIPKPRGYFRIDLPEHAYKKYDSDCPFTFDFGHLARIEKVRAQDGGTCWFNISYPEHKSKIHFSYFDISEKDIDKIVEDTRILAMKHLAKADDFEENIVKDTVGNVYGVIYDFQGGSASNMQFFLTDSTNHLVRGALYFEVPPNADSLAPVEMYIEEEVYALINSFQWK